MIDNVVLTGKWDSSVLNRPQVMEATVWLGEAIKVPFKLSVTVVTDAYIDEIEAIGIVSIVTCGVANLLPHVTLPYTISNDGSFVMVIEDAN